MKISSLIPEGRQNAMGRTELRKRAMIKDRLMRSLIEEERRSGTVIINLQDGRGYFKPAPEDIQHVLKQYRQNQSRAMSILVQQKHLRRILKEAGVEI